MNKPTKMIGSSAIALSMLLSTGALSHDVDAKTSSVNTVDVSKPYYYYNGYFKPNAKQVLLDKGFKAAIDNDNVSINGYSVSKKRMTKSFAPTGFYEKDVLINKFGKKVTSILLEPQKKSITKKEFLKAYKGFKLVKVDQTAEDKSVATYVYKTSANTKFQAYFENGYLVYFTIL